MESFNIFTARITKDVKLSDLATELKPTTVMSEIFKEPTIRGYLCIIVDILDPDKLSGC